jgi:hypothetical protein
LLLGTVTLVADLGGRKNWPVLAVIAAMALAWIPRSGTLALPAMPAWTAAADPAALAGDRIENLPRVPTAVFPFEASIAPASGVELRQFPAVQAPQSYTRGLDAWNAAAVTKAEQIVVHWDAIDGRHPFLDAPALTLAMIEHYDFAQQLGNRLLLNRRATPRFTSLRKMGEGTLRIGEPFRLPLSNDTRLQLVRVELRLTPQGEWMKLLWKLPPAQILLSAAGGRVLAARLVPDVLGNPAGLAFLPSSLENLRQMLERNVVADPFEELLIQAEYYEREARVEYFEIEDWKGLAIERAPLPSLTGLLDQGEARAAKIESLNGVGVVALGASEIAEVPAHDGYVLVKGWAFDYFETKPASAVYLQIDGKMLVKAAYGELRLDNVALFQHNHALAPTGFSALIPNSKLGTGTHEVRLVVVSTDGRRYASSPRMIRFRTS